SRPEGLLCGQRGEYGAIQFVLSAEWHGVAVRPLGVFGSKRIIAPQSHDGAPELGRVPRRNKKSLVGENVAHAAPGRYDDTFAQGHSLDIDADASLRLAILNQGKNNQRGSGHAIEEKPLIRVSAEDLHIRWHTEAAHTRAMRVHVRLAASYHLHWVGQVLDSLEQGSKIPMRASPAKDVALLVRRHFKDVREPIDLKRNIAEPGGRDFEQALEIAGIPEVDEQPVDTA